MAVRLDPFRKIVNVGWGGGDDESDPPESDPPTDDRVWQIFLTTGNGGGGSLNFGLFESPTIVNEGPGTGASAEWDFVNWHSGAPDGLEVAVQFLNEPNGVDGWVITVAVEFDGSLVDSFTLTQEDSAGIESISWTTDGESGFFTLTPF